MKIAHLILAHAEPKQLERLIKRLSHPDADFYIHLDLKADIEQFSYLTQIGNTYFIQKRLKIEWGTYSLVQATLNSFEEILGKQKTYDFFNLMSAQDYPIKSTDYIHEFLSRNKGRAFMHCLSIQTEWLEGQIRLQKYDFGTFKFRGKYRLQAVWNALMPKRKMLPGLQPYGRSQWFTMPPTCVAYVINYLKENPKVEKFFRFTWAADEVVFQTIIWNSPLRDMIYNDNLRYIDWSEGKTNPKVLKMEDATALLNSGSLFARKFNTRIDEQILSFLDMHSKVSGQTETLLAAEK